MGKQLSKSEYASALGWNRDLVSADEFILFYHWVYSLPVNKTMQKMQACSNKQAFCDEDVNDFLPLQNVVADPEIKNKVIVIERGARAKRRKVNIRMKRRKFEHPAVVWRQVLQKRGNRAIRHDSRQFEHEALHTLESEYDALDSWKAKEIARNELATAELGWW